MILVDSAAVRAILGLPITDTHDQDMLMHACAAVEALVSRLRPDLTAATIGADQQLGLTMAAAELVRSRGGTDDQSDWGAGQVIIPPLISRTIAQLVGLGTHYPPAIA
jgi:hypothetical protein